MKAHTPRSPAKSLTCPPVNFTINTPDETETEKLIIFILCFLSQNKV